MTLHFYHPISYHPISPPVSYPTPRHGRKSYIGCFTEKAEAERRARELHGKDLGNQIVAAPWVASWFTSRLGVEGVVKVLEGNIYWISFEITLPFCWSTKFLLYFFFGIFHLFSKTTSFWMFMGTTQTGRRHVRGWALLWVAERSTQVTLSGSVLDSPRSVLVGSRGHQRDAKALPSEAQGKGKFGKGEITS